MYHKPREVLLHGLLHIYSRQQDLAGWGCTGCKRAGVEVFDVACELYGESEVLLRIGL